MKIPGKYKLLFAFIAVFITLVTSSIANKTVPTGQTSARQTQQKQSDVLSPHGTATVSAYVQRVIDGDTIEVLIGSAEAKVRLIGIDTPETVDPRTQVECYGKEASNRLKELIEGTFVRMEGDSSQQDRDRYNRLLRYVYLGDSLINKQLVMEGYATEYTYNTPYVYQEEFRAAQKEAEHNARGLWNPQLCVQNQNSGLQ